MLRNVERMSPRDALGGADSDRISATVLHPCHWFDMLVANVIAL